MSNAYRDLISHSCALTGALLLAWWLKERGPSIWGTCHRWSGGVAKAAVPSRICGHVAVAQLLLLQRSEAFPRYSHHVISAVNST